MTDTKNDPHTELMRMIQVLEISAAHDGCDEHPTDRTQQAYECVNAYARTLTDRLERAERMFGTACADLGAINEALGLDPDDGGAEPIIDAIQEMQSCGPTREALAGRGGSIVVEALS